MASKAKPVCPRCQARRKDWLLCEPCTELLRNRLQWLVSERTGSPEGNGRQTLPWERQRRSWDVHDELLTSLTRQGCSDKPTVGRSAERPLPYDEHASNALARLNYVLKWAAESVWDCRSDGEICSDLASWLLQHVERIRGQLDHAAIIVNGIDAAVRDVINVIDNKRDNTPDQHAADDPRLKLIDDQLATRREILDAMPALTGHRVTSQRFSMWVSRGRLTPHGEGRYRVGDAIALTRRNTR